MKSKNFAATVCLFALLAACGGGGGTTGGDPPQPPGNTDETPTLTITPVGESNGVAVTQAVDANGGTVSASQIQVKVPAGAISSGSITVQPIANNFAALPSPDQPVAMSVSLRRTAQAVAAPGAFPGVGQAVEITSDAPWVRHLTVTFPMSDDELNSGGLMGIAVQQPDGSWRFLSPVRIDAAAHTISAGLPYFTEANHPSQMPTALRTTTATTTTTTKRVAKSWSFWMNNNHARLPTKTRTQLMMPFALEFRNPDPACDAPPPNPTPEPPDPNGPNANDDGLAPLIDPKCWDMVGDLMPLRNRKDGYTREWTVDALGASDSSNGKIDSSPEFGAYFTTPDHLRNSLHDILFKSKRTADTTNKEVAFARASVQVFKKAPPTSYSGHVNSQLTFDGNDPVWQVDGELKLELRETFIDKKHPGEITTPGVTYDVVGTTLTGVVFSRDCTAVSADVPASGWLDVDLDTGTYDLHYQNNSATDQLIHRTSSCNPPPGSPPGTPRPTMDVVIQYLFDSNCENLNALLTRQGATEGDISGVLPPTACFLVPDAPLHWSIQGTWDLKKVGP